MNIAARIIVLLLSAVPFLSHAASNQYLAGPSTIEHVWYPKVPPRAAGAGTYCSVWASKVIYGIAAYLRASTDERTRSLVVTYQTKAEDEAKPEVFRSVSTDDGSHATVIVLTDGYDENGHWYLDEDGKRWAEEVFFYGWSWAGTHPVSAADAQRGQLWWIVKMHAWCMLDADL